MTIGFQSSLPSSLPPPPPPSLPPPKTGWKQIYLFRAHTCSLARRSLNSAHLLTHSLTRSLTHLKKVLALLTLPKTSAPVPRASERASAAVACRAASASASSSLRVGACGSVARLSCFHLDSFSRARFSRRRSDARVPRSSRTCPKSQSGRPESGFRVGQPADALSALRRLSRRISR